MEGTPRLIRWAITDEQFAELRQFEGYKTYEIDRLAIRLMITEEQYDDLARAHAVGWTVTDPAGNVVEAGPPIQMQAVADMREAVPDGEHRPVSGESDPQLDHERHGVHDANGPIQG